MNDLYSKWDMSNGSINLCAEALPKFLLDIGMPYPRGGERISVTINNKIVTFEFQCDQSDPLGCWSECK